MIIYKCTATFLKLGLNRERDTFLWFYLASMNLQKPLSEQCLSDSDCVTADTGGASCGNVACTPSLGTRHSTKRRSLGAKELLR